MHPQDRQAAMPAHHRLEDDKILGSVDAGLEDRNELFRQSKIAYSHIHDVGHDVISGAGSGSRLHTSGSGDHSAVF